MFYGFCFVLKLIAFFQTVPPYCKILSSPAFHALNILHYGNLWGLFFLLTIAPEFMADELGFNFQSAGLYSSLPHLARFLAGFIFGWIGDCLRRRNTSPNCTRKSFCVFCKKLYAFMKMACFENNVRFFQHTSFRDYYCYRFHISKSLVLL